MSRLTFVAALVGIAGLLGQPVAWSQDKDNKFEALNIVTADSVKLKAHYYASPKTPAPVVILLHPVGDGKTMKTPEWTSLAETLQKANFNVIMFDFRGHGDSTSIEVPRTFWNAQVPGTKMFPNLNVKPKDPKSKEEIDVKDYIKQGNAYLPILVNDIAAVRAYLDRRNDDIRDCNTSNIFVIGADSGATIGALWINSENYRYKYVGDHTKNFWKREIGKAANYTDCAGADITGAVFLTIQPNFEKRKVNASSLLKMACKERAMATLFVYGKDDKDAATYNTKLAKDVKLNDSNKHRFIGAFDLPTSLSGIKLLQKGVRDAKEKRTTEDNIVVYFNSILEDRKKSERTVRDFPNTDYRWKFPSGATIPARETNLPYLDLKKGEKNLLFDDYAAKFLPQ
jgi:pimeloyl-ACP methyl ester carboxylesterase